MERRVGVQSGVKQHLVFIIHSVGLEDRKIRKQIAFQAKEKKKRGLNTCNRNLHFQWRKTWNDWEPVRLNYRCTGRYQIQIRFITTYERGLIPIWQYQNSCTFFFLLMLSCFISDLCHLRGKNWVTWNMQCKKSSLGLDTDNRSSSTWQLHDAIGGFFGEKVIFILDSRVWAARKHQRRDLEILSHFLQISD